MANGKQYGRKKGKNSNRSNRGGADNLGNRSDGGNIAESDKQLEAGVHRQCI